MWKPHIFLNWNIFLFCTSLKQKSSKIWGNRVWRSHSGPAERRRTFLYSDNLIDWWKNIITAEFYRIIYRTFTGNEFSLRTHHLREKPLTRITPEPRRRLFPPPSSVHSLTSSSLILFKLCHLYRACERSSPCWCWCDGAGARRTFRKRTSDYRCFVCTVCGSADVVMF